MAVFIFGIEIEGGHLKKQRRGLCVQCSIIQNTFRRCQEETLRAMQKAFCPHVQALSDCSFDFLPRSTAAASDRSQVHVAALQCTALEHCSFAALEHWSCS